MINGKLQWHPAFQAAMRIELAENIEFLDFHDEHLLGKKPMQIDLLIIKKQPEIHIAKKIGHIFREHNLTEYKSPEDSLSVNDFYKVQGYACFYISDTPKVGEISYDQVTLTFVCTRYPYKLLTQLKHKLNITAVPYDKGIYYLKGAIFPTQLIIIRQLSKSQNYWLQSLRKNLSAGGEIQELIKRYERNKNSLYHQAVMDVIMRANWKAAEEEKKMCEALRELFADELKEMEKQGMEKGMQKGMQVNYTL